MKILIGSLAMLCAFDILAVGYGCPPAGSPCTQTCVIRSVWCAPRVVQMSPLIRRETSLTTLTERVLFRVRIASPPERVAIQVRIRCLRLKLTTTKPRHAAPLALGLPTAGRMAAFLGPSKRHERCGYTRIAKANQGENRCVRGRDERCAPRDGSGTTVCAMRIAISLDCCCLLGAGRHSSACCVQRHRFRGHIVAACVQMARHRRE